MAVTIPTGVVFSLPSASIFSWDHFSNFCVNDDEEEDTTASSRAGKVTDLSRNQTQTPSVATHHAVHSTIEADKEVRGDSNNRTLAAT